MVVDETVMNGSLEQMVSMQERQAVLNQLELNEDGRFPCRFPGCKASFKYNGKSRRRHELGHDPQLSFLTTFLMQQKSLQLRQLKLQMTSSITMLHSCLKGFSF